MSAVEDPASTTGRTVSAGPPAAPRGIAVGGLTAVAAVLGCWALLLPASFATDLGLTAPWVLTDGPYNEHLIRDVGGLYLALAVLTLGVGRRRDRSLDRLVGVAWLVTAVPHLAYHAGHLHPFPLVDAVAQVGALALVVGLALVLALAPSPLRRRTP